MKEEQFHYTTVTLNGWHEFKSFILQFSENWAFRGQYNSNWVLNNAIERTDFIRLYKGIEADFLAEFQRGARNYLSKDETPGHLIEWLALMQHHGAPTRLLDLTKSPFIAAFFAFEQCNSNQEYPIGIWSVNINYLKSRALEFLSEAFGSDLKQSNGVINEQLFERIFFQNDQQLVFPVEPFRMNRRYSLQQSVFISTGVSDIPLMAQLQFLGSGIENAIVKIEVPANCKKEVIRELQQMNMNRASLFPDLDGYAASLRLRYNSLKTPKQFMEENIKKLEDENYRFIP